MNVTSAAGPLSGHRSLRLLLPTNKCNELVGEAIKPILLAAALVLPPRRMVVVAVPSVASAVPSPSSSTPLGIGLGFASQADMALWVCMRPHHAHASPGHRRHLEPLE